MKVLVIIPAYNEELNIKKVVSNLIDHYPQYNYVVVNDGSADSTSQICHQEGYNMTVRFSLMRTGSTDRNISKIF